MATEKDQSWEQWVAAFNQPNAAAVGVAPAPATTGGLSQSNLNNINTLFSPTFGSQEVQMNAAENAIAGGWGSGGFAGNQGIRLLDSERKANFQLGAQLLEPYLQRESAASLQASDQAARLNQIAAEGAQALQRLQLSEAGQGARLSAELAAKLQQQVLEGQQAMQRLTLTEAGAAGRNNADIQGTLANTLLSAALAGKGTSTGTGGTRPGTRGTGFNDISTGDSYTGPGTSITNYGSGNSIVGYRAPYNAAAERARGVEASGTLGLGSSSIDFLLRKYGLLQ